MQATRYAQFLCLRPVYNESQNTVSTHLDILTTHHTPSQCPHSAAVFPYTYPPLPIPFHFPKPNHISNRTYHITAHHTIPYHTSQPLPTIMSSPSPPQLGHAGVLADPAITHIVITQPAAVPGWVAAQKQFDDGLKAVPAPPIRLLYKAWVSREMAKGKSRYQTTSWSSGRMGGRWDAEGGMW
jgi:hypothetical protein